MKRTIVPYPNKGISGGENDNSAAATPFPKPLNNTRQELLRHFEAFAETINKSSSARDLGPAFGTASETSKRTLMLSAIEKQFKQYAHQLEHVYAKHNWKPSDEIAYSTGDATVDALRASYQEKGKDADKIATTPTENQNNNESNNNNNNNNSDSSEAMNALSAANIAPYYFYWSNCLGDSAATTANHSAPTTGSTSTRNHAIADWRYDLASLQFNMATIYLNCAAHLSFLSSVSSWPNYYSKDDVALVSHYAQVSMSSALEKEAYSMCCTAAYHYEKAAERMQSVIGTAAAAPPSTTDTNNVSTSSEPNNNNNNNSNNNNNKTSSEASSPSSSTSAHPPTDKPQYTSSGKGDTQLRGITHVASDAHDLPAGYEGVAKVLPEHVPVDMSQSFLSLMREVMLAQGQEITIAKAVRASREDESVSKMTFTSITGRLMLGAKLLFSNAESFTQRDIVVVKMGFASFVASIQMKAALFEAIAYSVQGAYMAVPITSGQRMEMAISEKERAATGAPPSANVMGDDAGANPEEGLWCAQRAADLSKSIADRSKKTSCSPSVQLWCRFMMDKYITEVGESLRSLQQMGLGRKAAAGPVPLKSAMVVARVRAPVIENPVDSK